MTERKHRTWNWIALMLLALLALAVAVAPVQATTFKLLSSWPQNMLFVTGSIEPFNKNLKKLSGGSMGTQYFGPDVIPAMEQLQPVQAGVFDMLYTIPAYHMGTTAVGAAVDAMEPGPKKMRDSGVFDYIDGQYQNIGLKLVAIVPLTDLHFLTRVPVDDRNPSFNGLKLRTISTVAPLVKELGGAAVNMPSGEVYTALQKGIIDGATIITFGATDLKWNEATKYMVRPTFGFISTLLLMNLEKFESLSQEDQAALEKAGAKTELEGMAFFADKKAAEENTLRELGIKETHMSPEDAVRADAIYKETIWMLTEAKSGEAVKELHNLAKSKGLSK